MRLVLFHILKWPILIWFSIFHSEGFPQIKNLEFAFQGNTFLSKKQLEDYIAEEQFIEPFHELISKIQERIQQEYQNLGFSQVQIDCIDFPKKKSFSSQQRKVVYRIQEGPRTQISSIQFDDNIHFSKEVLKNKFYTFASPALQNHFYVKKDIQNALDALLNWLRTQGYLSASASIENEIMITTHLMYSTQRRKRKKNQWIPVIIKLQEGKQTIVQKIEISGAHIFSQENIKNFLQLKKNQPLNLPLLLQKMEDLKKLYYEKGYLDFKILNEDTPSLIQYQQENRLAHLQFQLSEGVQAILSKIKIEGLCVTQPQIVQKEFLFHEGDILLASQITKTEKRLERLKIFSRINFVTHSDPKYPHYKTLQIILQEAPRGSLVWGLGFRNDLGIRLFSQLSYLNLWGKNHSVSLDLYGNRRFSDYHFIEFLLRCAYQWPRLIPPKITFRPTFSISRNQYSQFSANAASMIIPLETKFFKHPKLIGKLDYTFEWIKQFQAKASKNNKELRIAAITPKLILDMRNHPSLPTSGIYSSSDIELALPSFGGKSDTAYYRFQFQFDYYVPIKKMVWYQSLKSGYAKNLIKTGIPLSKQFRLSGNGNIRGFQEEELNPQNLNFQESLAYVSFQTQLDFPLFSNFKLGIFLDVGNLFTDHHLFFPFLFGIGIGLHYHTPVGPLNVDFAFRPPFKIYPSSLHFSIGSS